VSWTAPAKRSGDGAFARPRDPRALENRRPHESTVALPAAVHDAPRNSYAPPLLLLAGTLWPYSPVVAPRRHDNSPALQCRVKFGMAKVPQGRLKSIPQIPFVALVLRRL